MKFRLSFIDWLRAQVTHDTATGDLARDVEQDRCLGDDVTTAARLGAHIGRNHRVPGTEAAMIALGRSAQAEYGRHLRPGWVTCWVCPPHPVSGLPRTHTEWSALGRKHRDIMAERAARLDPDS